MGVGVLVRRGATITRDTLLDAADALRGRRDPMIPPRRQTFVGGSDYRRTGDEFLRYFVELARLQPDERVLDVGCGSGRMARPLTGYLRPPGSYDGFDIVPRGIDWAHHTISARFPHFRFQLADVRNDMYNPDGLVPAAEYRFPYADETFDLVVLTSVFTHMRAAEVRHYLDEVARVLRPGGRCLITFFLLNDESRPAIANGASDFTFRYGDGIARFDLPTKPEAAVAYEEDAVRAWFDAVELSTEEPIRYGSWCRRPISLSYQDILVASKPPGERRPVVSHSADGLHEPRQLVVGVEAAWDAGDVLDPLRVRHEV